MSELSPGYQTVRGSDVQRDGMYLKLIDQNTGDEVAEVFYSDSTHEMVISIFKPELPLAWNLGVSGRSGSTGFVIVVPANSRSSFRMVRLI